MEGSLATVGWEEDIIGATIGKDVMTVESEVSPLFGVKDELAKGNCC